jgi:teichuronic acid biosynthesis glycosyltransferase TuaG
MVTPKTGASTAIYAKKKIAFSYTQYYCISANNEFKSPAVVIPSHLGYKQLLKNTAIATLTVMIDLEKTGPVAMLEDREYSRWEDLILWLDILKKGVTAYGLQENLSIYRVVNNSLSQNKINNAIGVWKIYRKIEKLDLLLASWSFINYAINGYKKYQKNKRL